MTNAKLTVYSLKSRFQKLLIPFQNRLIVWNISPNRITLFTCVLCVFYAALLAWLPFTHTLLLFLPAFMLLRLALNALDGMVATKTKNKTPLGGVLNEVCDVVSDAAVFSAFLIVLPAYHVAWWLVPLLALLIEFVTLSTYQVKQKRSQNGPFGKSDRAVYLGVFAVILWLFPQFLAGPSIWTFAYILLGIALACLTLWNRLADLAWTN